MAFRWRADGGSSLNGGLVALWCFRVSRPVLLRNPTIFLWFSRWGGGGSGHPATPPWIRAGISSILWLSRMVRALPGRKPRRQVACGMPQVIYSLISVSYSLPKLTLDWLIFAKIFVIFVRFRGVLRPSSRFYNEYEDNVNPFMQMVW